MRHVLEENPGITVVFEFAPSLLLRAGEAPERFLQEVVAAGFAISRIHELTGELLPTSREELLSSFSVNLAARREVAG
jgi:hypothetical protein